MVDGHLPKSLQLFSLCRSHGRREPDDVRDLLRQQLNPLAQLLGITLEGAGQFMRDLDHDVGSLHVAICLGGADIANVGGVGLFGHVRQPSQPLK